MHYGLDLSKLIFFQKSDGRITKHQSLIIILETPTLLLIKQRYMFNKQKHLSPLHTTVTMIFSIVMQALFGISSIPLTFDSFDIQSKNLRTEEIG